MVTDDPKILRPRLLSEQELLDLMEAEHLANGSTLSAKDLEVGFERLSAALPRSRSVWSGPLAMAALLLIGLAPFVFRGSSPSQPGSSGVKGLDPGLPVRLTAYELTAGGSLKVVGDEPLLPGAVIVFKVGLPSAAYVALGIAEGHGAPLVRFESMPLEAGEDRIVERDHEAYAYKVDGDEQQFTICALAEADSERLASLTEKLAEMFPKLSGAACITGTVQGAP